VLRDAPERDGQHQNETDNPHRRKNISLVAANESLARHRNDTALPNLTQSALAGIAGAKAQVLKTHCLHIVAREVFRLAVKERQALT
jgi:hypothetical protein